MSVTVNYFFNASETLNVPVNKINGCLGCSLKPEQDNPEVYAARLLGMDLTLSQAGDYVNDRELDFEDFKFELGLTTWAGYSELRPIQLASMVASIYALHCFFGITGILVYDMNILLARYGEHEVGNHGAQLHDLMSGTTPMTYSDHLAIVSSRLPHR